MADHTDREHYIPIRQNDLVELLCQELGADQDAVAKLRRLNAIVSATFGCEAAQLLHELKDQYDPFDPDCVTRPIRKTSDDDRAAALDRLCERFVHLMERANFRRLTLDEVKATTKEASAWGLNMDVDFNIFERFEVFVRGDAIRTRTLRRWYRFWRREPIHLPVHERLVLLIKMKPSKRLPSEIDTQRVYLKLFKDIPKVDLEMMLPGAKLKMPGLDRLKLGTSLVGSLLWILYSMLNELLMLVRTFSTSLILGPLAALLGYGYKQWFGYQSTRTQFSLRLAESLYYRTLGTNLSVLFHLLDEAEEQECREALLGYYYLWRRAGASGWTEAELDDHVEHELSRLAELKVNFEIHDVLAKLERLKLVRKSGDRWIAEPIEQALAALDHAWDNYFAYHRG